MAKKEIVRENRYEDAIWLAIVMTWPLYAIGGLYILAPVMAWWGTYLVVFGVLPTRSARGDLFFTPGAMCVLVWVIGMIIMQVALVMGHMDWELGLPKTIKSSIGWAKGWALIALFIVIGFYWPVRPIIVYRACSVVAIHTLILIPIMIVSYYIGLPGTLYISPLKALGGAGAEFFEVQFFGINPESQGPRWRFFTPWAPAAGMMANYYLVMIVRDPNKRNVYLGIFACILMCLMCQSRAGLVCLFVVIPLTIFVSSMTKPPILFFCAFASFFLGLFIPDILDFIDTAISEFKAQRPGSSRVRDALGNIAVQRWQDEAPIWGHGIVEKGPHLVEYMPIGSHHSWFGLLYVKGIVGFYALAIPMGLTFIILSIKAQKSPEAATAWALLLITFMFTFGENLEILVYLYWPALVAIGIGLRPNHENRMDFKEAEVKKKDKKVKAETSTEPI